MADLNTMNVMPAGRSEDDMKLLGYMMQDKLASEQYKTIPEAIRGLCADMADIRNVQMEAGEKPTLDIHIPITEKGEYAQTNDLNLICDETGNISARIFQRDTLKYDLGGIKEGSSDFTFFQNQEAHLNNEYEAIGSINLSITRSSIANAFHKMAAEQHSQPDKIDSHKTFNVITEQMQNNSVPGFIRRGYESPEVLASKAHSRAEYDRLSVEIDNKYRDLIKLPELTKDADGNDQIVPNTAFLAAWSKEKKLCNLTPQALDSIENAYFGAADGTKQLRELFTGDYTNRVMINFAFPDGHCEIHTFDEMENLKYLFQGDRDVVKETLDTAAARLAQNISTKFEQKMMEKDQLMSNPQLREGFTYKYDVLVDGNPVAQTDLYISPVRDTSFATQDINNLAQSICNMPEAVHQMAAAGLRIEPEVTIQNEDSTIKARLNNNDKKLVTELKARSIKDIAKLLFNKKENIPQKDLAVYDEMKKTDLSKALTTRGQFVDAVLQYMNRVNEQLPEQDKLISIQAKAAELVKWDEARGIKGSEHNRRNIAVQIAMERYESSLSKHKELFVKETKNLIDALHVVCRKNSNIFFVDMDYYKNNALVHSTAMISPGDNVTVIENGKSTNLRIEEFIPMFASSITAQRITETLEREVMASIAGKDNSIINKNRAGARAGAGIESMTLDEKLGSIQKNLQIQSKVKSIENKQKDDGDRT